MAIVNWTENGLVQKHIQESAAYVAECLMDRNNRWFRCSSTYDSPIEVVFAIWWRALASAGQLDESAVVLQNQQEVEVRGRKYRVDFELQPSHQLQARAVAVGVTWQRIAVELDGHEWHERTKEQVAYRNQRDRDLQDAGWMVLHFSGSEMVRDPSGCITQAFGAAYKAYDWDWEMSIMDREHDKAKEAAASEV